MFYMLDFTILFIIAISLVCMKLNFLSGVINCMYYCYPSFSEKC